MSATTYELLKIEPIDEKTARLTVRQIEHLPWQLWMWLAELFGNPQSLVRVTSHTYVVVGRPPIAAHNFYENAEYLDWPSMETAHCADRLRDLMIARGRRIRHGVPTKEDCVAWPPFAVKPLVKPKGERTRVCALCREDVQGVVLTCLDCDSYTHQECATEFDACCSSIGCGNKNKGPAKRTVSH